MEVTFRRGFLETLAALSEVGLTPDEAEAILNGPGRCQTTTWVALTMRECVD